MRSAISPRFAMRTFRNIRRCLVRGRRVPCRSSIRAGRSSMTRISWPYSTASPDSTRLAPTIAVDGRDDLLGTPSMSTAPSRSPARTRVPAAGRPAAVDADGRRGRHGARFGARACLRVQRTMERRAARVSPARSGPPSGRSPPRRDPPRLALPGAARVDRRRRPAGRRSRTRQPPSRTSSSPRPVAPSLAMSAGSSSSVSRSIAAWSAARSAAPRRVRAHPPGCDLGTRYTSSRAGGSSRDQLSVTGAMPRRAGSSRSRKRSARRRSTRSGTSGWAASV